MLLHSPDQSLSRRHFLLLVSHVYGPRVHIREINRQGSNILPYYYPLARWWVAWNINSDLRVGARYNLRDGSRFYAAMTELTLMPGLLGYLVVRNRERYNRCL